MSSFALAFPPRARPVIRSLLQQRIDDWMQLSFRHELLVARAVRGLQIEATARFDAVVVRPMLREIGARLATLQLRTGNLLRDTMPEVMSLRDAIEKVAAQGTDQIRRVTEDRMAEIARGEVRWIGQTMSVLDKKFGAGTATPFGEGVVNAAGFDAKRTLWLGDSTEKWFESMLQQPTADRTRAWVTTGIQEGLTVDEITRGLVGTRTQTGVLEKPREAVNTLVRTSATHASAIGRTEAFKSLGVKWWRFVATLDSKTSLQCAAHDGEIFPIGEGPMPPLHPNCRSVMTPAFSENEEPIGTRASIDGQVPATTTFSDWIEKMPAGEQDKWFGKAKGAAFRAGKVALKDLLGRDLQPLTLSELRDLERL